MQGNRLAEGTYSVPDTAAGALNTPQTPYLVGLPKNPTQSTKSQWPLLFRGP